MIEIYNRSEEPETIPMCKIQGNQVYQDTDGLIIVTVEGKKFRITNTGLVRLFSPFQTEIKGRRVIIEKIVVRTVNTRTGTEE